MLRKKLKFFFSKSGKKSEYYHGKWLRLDKGKNGQDLITRTTDEFYYSGVNILAIKEEKKKKSLKLIAIGNFRIPTGKRILEVPAGLAEKNLTVEENIVKELKEETGVNIFFFCKNLKKILVSRYLYLERYWDRENLW